MARYRVLQNLLLARVPQVRVVRLSEGPNGPERAFGLDRPASTLGAGRPDTLFEVVHEHHVALMRSGAEAPETISVSTWYNSRISPLQLGLGYSPRNTIWLALFRRVPISLQ